MHPHIATEVTGDDVDGVACSALIPAVGADMVSPVQRYEAGRQRVHRRRLAQELVYTDAFERAPHARCQPRTEDHHPVSTERRGRLAQPAEPVDRAAVR
jgi:hypothetical protein